MKHIYDIVEFEIFKCSCDMLSTVVVASAYSQDQIVLEKTAVRCAGSFEDLLYQSVKQIRSLNISFGKVS